MADLEPPSTAAAPGSLDGPKPVDRQQPRKRQRPGLSCLECHRRKIKCNQARPCDQCTKGRRPGCAYGPRSNVSEQPIHLWAMGRPESFNLSSDNGRNAVPMPAYVVSKQQGLMGSITGSPTSERVANNASQSNVSLPSAQPFLTPGASPSMQVVGSERQASTLGSASAAQTPRSDDSYPRPWMGSDQWNRSAPRAPSSESIDDLRRRMHQIEQNVLEAKCPLTESTSNKPFTVTDISDISAHGETAARPLRGILSKTRLFGLSHWMCYFDQFEKIYNFSHSSNWQSNCDLSTFEINEIHELLRKCKDLARVAKGQQTLYRPLVGTSLEWSVPSREISDRLVQLYFESFESIYRILHEASFEREYAQYWQNPKSVNNGFIIKLLLVLSVGISVYHESEISLRSLARQWIYAAQSWLSAPFEKSRLNMNGLQIYCLLLLSRQANAVESDLVWISAGSLLRTAMQMGLHRDPKQLPKMSVLCAELRRRLWVTIMEIAVQSSLDSGLPALISFQDCDTLPPSNIDDNEIDETTEVLPPSKDRTIFTQTSLQLALLQSLRTRHEIARLINDFHSDPSYDEILQLGRQITNACRQCGLLMRTYSRQTSISGQAYSPTAFHRNLIDALLRSFLFVLHRPSAAKARKDPKFYFSRKICLETALAFISPEPSDNFSHLMAVGGGFIRNLVIHSGSMICLEIITQLEEDFADITLQRTKTMREPLRRAVRSMVDLAEKRVELGENNVRGHMFYSMVVGQIEAMETGTSQEKGIYEGAKKSANICYGLLKARMPTSAAAAAPLTDASSSDNAYAPRPGIASGGDIPSVEVDVQDFGFEFLQDGALNEIDLPDSWLFTDWDAISEE